MKRSYQFAVMLWALTSQAGGLLAGPEIVAHRGASKDAPENTLPAFALAWERGADAIEGDFHLTRDGEIVCIHDKDTKRVAGVNKLVRSTSLEELRELDVGLWRGEEWKGVKIPTLGEVMATVPRDKKIFIEIKCGPEIVPRLLADVGGSGLEKDQVVFISFHAPVIGALEKEAAEIDSYWLTSFKLEKSGELRPSAESVLATLDKIRTDGVSTGKNHVSGEFIKRVMGAGHEYHVWTVDDPKEARRFEAWGALSITTNVPGKIREELRRE